MLDLLNWGDTLEQAKAKIAEVLETGDSMTCPACQQNVKKYERAIYKAMLKPLIHLTKVNKAEASVLSKICGSGEYAKLSYWDLIKRNPDDTWCITSKGYDFLRGIIRIPKYAYVYNAEFLGLSEKKTVSVKEIDPHFDLSALLGRFDDDERD